jgi:HEAT repeat protein
MPFPSSGLFRVVFLATVCLVGVSHATAAQQAAAPRSGASQRPAANAPSESVVLARGWTALSRGDTRGASSAAAEVLSSNPRSVAALSLSVEAALEQGGAAAALAAYERWLGDRRIEDAYVVRRVARGLLVEAASKSTDPLVRSEAQRALAADGDKDASATIEKSAAGGNAMALRTLAGRGDERAVASLVTQMQSMGGGPRALIVAALGESGSRQAVAPLIPILQDTNVGTRAAAAEALGRLGAPEAVPYIAPLLADPVFNVRLKASGALFRLNDPRGLPLLDEVARSEFPAVRLGAAQEMSSRPDATWQTLVRGLLDDNDPVVRLDAAKLIAPHDPAAASRVFQELSRSDNPAIQEVATSAMAQQLPADVTALRLLLRSPEALVRVRAGARILEMVQ